MIILLCCCVAVLVVLLYVLIVSMQYAICSNCLKLSTLPLEELQGMTQLMKLDLSCE
jgi:hypothetical protein